MGGKMASSLKHGALAALVLTSLVLSVLVLVESDLNAFGKKPEVEPFSTRLTRRQP